MSALEIANSLPMWIACGLAVAVVIIQALLFAIKAYGAGKKVGLTEKQMKKAMKSSAITSIGPSIVILSGMLSLLITVGAPVAWMRLSMIGSVMFESLAAGIGTNVVGVQLGVDELTHQALAMAVWTMVLCSIGWVIFATFSANRMDKIQNKLGGGDAQKLISISVAAVIGVFAAMCAQHLVKILQFNPETKAFAGVGFSKHAFACVLGGVIMGIMMQVSKKIPALKEWNLTISILAAMIIAAVI
ncbi:MAG: DUF5058 family protein [Eubacteriales bacterium]|nr:DUF5058 family protein [Eubacteriales bacterium]